MTFKKVRWALRFPLPPPSKDPTARRFSSTPTLRQGPRSGEALEGAIRVAAPLSYANESSVYLPDSHFLKLPDYEGLFGPLRRNVNPFFCLNAAWLNGSLSGRSPFCQLN